MSIGGGVGEAALIQAALTGAAVGGGAAALTGGDPLKGALLGGITGGIGGGISGLGAAPAAAAPGAAGAAGAAGASGAGIAGAAAPEAISGLSASITPLSATPEALTAVPYADLSLYGPSATATPAIEAAQAAAPSASGWTSGYDLPMGQSPAQSGFVDPLEFARKNKTLVGASGIVGALGGRRGMVMPGQEKYTGPLSRFRYNPDAYQPADYDRYRAPGYANGGIAALDTPSLRSVPGPSMYRNPQQNYAAGGISQLGSYSDGGRMLQGPGDGMSDSIPASIAGKRPARLADGEFVVPADVVSGLGNGSTDAGAKQLYAMMDRVRRARTGTAKQGKQIKPQKQMPV